jgi:hypothetical protein
VRASEAVLEYIVVSSSLQALRGADGMTDSPANALSRIWWFRRQSASGIEQIDFDDGDAERFRSVTAVLPALYNQANDDGGRKITTRLHLLCAVIAAGSTRPGNNTFGDADEADLTLEDVDMSDEELAVRVEALSDLLGHYDGPPLTLREWAGWVRQEKARSGTPSSLIITRDVFLRRPRDAEPRAQPAERPAGSPVAARRRVTRNRGTLPAEAEAPAPAPAADDPRTPRPTHFLWRTSLASLVTDLDGQADEEPFTIIARLLMAIGDVARAAPPQQQRRGGAAPSPGMVMVQTELSKYVLGKSDFIESDEPTLRAGLANFLRACLLPKLYRNARLDIISMRNDFLDGCRYHNGSPAERRAIEDKRLASGIQAIYPVMSLLLGQAADYDYAGACTVQRRWRQHYHRITRSVALAPDHRVRVRRAGRVSDALANLCERGYEGDALSLKSGLTLAPDTRLDDVPGELWLRVFGRGGAAFARRPQSSSFSLRTARSHCFSRTSTACGCWPMTWGSGALLQPRSS